MEIFLVFSFDFFVFINGNIILTVGKCGIRIKELLNHGVELLKCELTARWTAPRVEGVTRSSSWAPDEWVFDGMMKLLFFNRLISTGGRPSNSGEVAQCEMIRSD